jgi:hypothetical protein
VADRAGGDAGHLAAIGLELLAEEGHEIDRRDVERREAGLARGVCDDGASMNSIGPNASCGRSPRVTVPA